MATLLLITVLLPLASSLVLFLGPRRDARSARSIALGTALATLAFSLILLLRFRTGVVTPQFAFGEEGGPYGWNWLRGRESASRWGSTASASGSSC